MYAMIQFRKRRSCLLWYIHILVLEEGGKLFFDDVEVTEMNTAAVCSVN